MKNALLLLSVFLSAGLFSQNWELIPSGEIFYYTYTNTAGESDGIPRNPVRVDSVAVVGQDSTFFLTRYFEYCDSCEVEGCLELVLPSEDGALGASIKKSSLGYQFIGSNVFFVPYDMVVGQNWEANAENSTTGQLDSLGMEAVFGEPDSIRYLTIGDKHLRWSKSYGWLDFSFPDASGAYLLSGIDGRDIGEYPPSFDEIFTWQVGDVFLFENWSGSSYGGNETTIRREVLEVITSGDSLSYLVEQAKRYRAFEYDMYWSQVFYSPILSKDTIVETYHQSDWKAASALPKKTIIGPPVLGVTENQSQFGIAPRFIWDYNVTLDFDLSYQETQEIIRPQNVIKDVNGEWILTNSISHESFVHSYEGNDNYWRHLFLPLSDSLWCFGQANVRANTMLFGRGLGIISLFSDGGLVVGSAYMSAYQTSTQQFGEIPTCEELLFVGIEELKAKNSIKVVNPIRDGQLQFYLGKNTTSTLQVRIYSLQGAEVLSTQIRSAPVVELDVSQLAKGSYILNVMGKELPRYNSIIIVE